MIFFWKNSFNFWHSQFGSSLQFLLQKSSLPIQNLWLQYDFSIFLATKAVNKLGCKEKESNGRIKIKCPVCAVAVVRRGFRRHYGLATIWQKNILLSNFDCKVSNLWNKIADKRGQLALISKCQFVSGNII